MKQELVTQPEMKLIGITVRTSNAAEFNPETAKIGATVHKYLSEAIYNKIPSPTKPGTTLCVYTEYESNHDGDFTYFIGQEVKENTTPPKGFAAITVPAQKYAKFTTDAGVMPQVCINGWLEIWKMDSEKLGGKRQYLADFEVYDHRAQEPENTILDIYIGIK